MSARKRPTSSSLPPDQHRSRPKRPKLDRSLLTLSSHVRLRWDGASKQAVPTEDQIGIPWSRLAPFVHSPPRRRASRLADVLPVPGEVFALDNLRRVLSYEVWDKCLTEADMKFLAQFLPTGTNTEETVHSLLTAKNHHFGNPLLSWSSALCYGDLHPDAVLTKERQIRADKKAYLTQINDYHSEMIEVLTKWKDRWLTCQNPERMFRDNPVKQKKGDRGENLTSSKAPSNAVPLKVVRNGDVTKFMSYIKITRSQHDLVKKLKQSGDGIQTKQLTAVIGDIDNFHVKPYDTLMEDEKKKLHDYWAIISSKELPAAFEVRQERKLMFENLRKSLCLELAVEEAEQVSGKIAYQNGGTSEGQEEPADDSPEHVPQAGHTSSTVPEHEDDSSTSDTDTSTGSHDSTDQDVNGTSDTGTSTDSHDSPNMSDQDAMDMNNTNITTQSQGSADEQDEELESTRGMNTSAKSGNSSGSQDEDMEDTSCKDYNPGPDDDDLEDTSCKHTDPQDHNIIDMQAQKPEAINHTISHIQGLNSPSVLVENCTNTSYAGFPIRGNGGLDEQTDELENMYCLSASIGHDNKKEMNRMILDQRGPESITVMPVLLSKPLHEQNNVEEGPELKEPAGYQKVLWQSVSPMDSSYRPPGDGLHAQSGAPQLKHQLSGGPAASVIDLGIDNRRQRQAQITDTTALPMCSPASLLPPDQLNGQQLLNNANGIGMVPSFSVGNMNSLQQSVELHSMTNGHLAQSGLLSHSMRNGHLAQSGLVQEQMQLLDESDSGLYSQQVEDNMYSGSTLGTFPMVDPQNFAPADQSHSWFPNEQPSHNNWSGMGSSGMVLGQDLPSGDGSLSSVLSQYKQVSSLAPISDQSLGRRNIAPSHSAPGVAGNTALPSPTMYGYTQNNNNNNNSQVDGSLQWAQGSHGNGMSHPSFRQFGGDPWSR